LFGMTMRYLRSTSTEGEKKEGGTVNLFEKKNN